MNQESIRGNDYKGILKVGQWVHSILYGGRDGIVCKINGDQKPETIQRLGAGMVMGGSATMDVVFEEYVSRGIPEGIIRGVQWYIAEEFATPEEITEALTHAEQAVAKKKEEERKAAEAKGQEKAELPAKYPFLTPLAKVPGKSSHAQGAKNLKIDLERTFPGIKFSLNSKSYSGGNSINVSWPDGPLQEEVEKISGKYQEGHFDGMSDLYEYGNSPFPGVFGGARYVSPSRHESRELIIGVAKDLGFNLTPADFDQWGNILDHGPNITWDQNRMIYRQARKTPGTLPEQKKQEETPTKATSTSRKSTKGIISAILA